MSDLLPPADFCQFPRRDLTFRLTRRGLLQQCAREMEVLGGEARGGHGYALAQLGSLPDDALYLLIPGMIPGSQISVAEGYVWGQPPDAAQPYPLFALDAAALAVFNGMNGRTPLQAIAADLSLDTGWELAQAFAYTRGLFLHLVQMRVCLPT